MRDHQTVEFLKSFHLEQHGDRRERQWWPLVKDQFPAYQEFWRLFVVPLTGRIIPGMPSSDPNWIRIRPNVSDRYMKLVMAHYSVFYCVGRSVDRLNQSGVEEYPEDVIYLLRASGENTERFLKVVFGMAEDSGVHLTLPNPHQFPKNYSRIFAEIKDYRDSILHYPVLGRASTTRGNLLSNHSNLTKIREDWRKAEVLSSAELIDAKALVSRLTTENLAALQMCGRD